MFTPESAIQCATVGPGRVAVYDIPVHWLTKGRNARYHEPKEGATGNPFDAARRSKRNAMDAAGWLFMRSRGHYVTARGGRRVYFRQGFWTLTLPKATPEPLARLALSAWFTWARNVRGLQSYLWAAELTERGRVHFHAILNTYIDQAEARAAWRRCLINAGALPPDAPALPPRAVKVERCKGAERGRLYAAKYVGKAFGGRRAEQLAKRLDDELNRTDRPPDAERVAELRARLGEAMEAARPSVRRWSCSQDCSRQAPTVNAAEDARIMERLRAELERIGANWSKPNEHGTVAYFDLGRVNSWAAPTLTRMLADAAGVNRN